MDPKQQSGASKRKAKKIKEANQADFLKSVPLISNFFEKPLNMSETSIANVSSDQSSSNEDVITTGLVSPVSDYVPLQTQSGAEQECQPWQATTDQQQKDHERKVAGVSDPQSDQPAASCECRFSNEEGKDPNSWCETVNDPALWPSTITDQARSILVSRGETAFQNRSAKYPASVRDRGIGGTSRSFTNALLSCSLPNGQTVTRQWLLYSPSTGCVYCFACKLFSSKHNTFVHGFSDWKHSERIGEHEGSVEHRACMLALYNRSRGTATIDSDIVKQIDAERQYWRDVLKRVVAVIQFLGERGLDELLGSAHNGNFLGIIELLSKFDPFLAEHLQRFGGKGKGSVSYLSSTVCEEFIHLMGQRTKQAIVNKIKESKYFSVIVDSTPDLAHVDQPTFIFRFVNNDAHVVERFLAFEPIENHSGDSLAECVVAMVENLGLDLSNCRGQSYDNASNMSGKYNGVQAHLKQRNSLICYVPCAAHSLNLVGVNAVDSSPEAGRFFDFVQAMFTFCASSTHRWRKVFRDTDIKLTLKSLSGTRWSARAESTKALWKYYAQLREALNDMSKDMEEKCVTRSEASALCDKLDTLETAFMAYFWDTILQRFQASSLQLQKHDIDICTAPQLLLSLRDFVAAQRDNFEVFEGAALNVTTAVSQEYRHDLQRTKKRKIMSDDSAEPGVAFNGKDKFRIETFNVVIDKLVSCLNHRLNAYTHLTELFDVLFMPDNMSNSELILKANLLAAAYPSDLNMSLADELIQYKSFITEKEKHPSKMLKTMINLNLQSTFPNVYIALRLFLTVPITNCEGERSFSKLARIKNELRIRMRQNRLNSLSLLAIESDLVRQLNFDELVDDFARKKSRKKHI
uniref:TTF-type domain-containing protein n=1 Tax=Astyanax mexicanus TaxID=7994 RepID=A0A3B1JF76_ASTMX